MNDPGPYRPLTYFQLMEISLRELLVEKAVVTEEELADEVEAMRKRGYERGARVVARAWVDRDYKQRLLANGTKACEELGLEVPALKLLVVENTPGVHNAIVCTLCSCYPRMLLGIPPEWYKSRNYRSRMVREPRAVLAEFGLEIAERVAVHVGMVGVVVQRDAAERRHHVAQPWPRARVHRGRKLLHERVDLEVELVGELDVRRAVAERHDGLGFDGFFCH